MQKLSKLFKDLATGIKTPENSAEKFFVYGYESSKRTIDFATMVTTMDVELESLSKDDLLYLIAGYSLVSIESQYGKLIELKSH